MNIVLGIGNPGKEYTGTRHNIGFEVVETLADRSRRPFRRWTSQASAAELSTPSGPLLVVKPLTYVNQSGKIIPSLAARYGPLGQEFMVVCDDINLPLGTLRIRKKGSSGGHNGLKSLIEALGTEDFPRMRLGVGAPEGEDAADYVLDRFRRSERAEVEKLVTDAAEAVETWIRDGIEKCMNRYNKKDTNR